MLIALCVTGWMLVVILVCFCGSIAADCRELERKNRALHDRIGIHQLEISGSSIESLIQAAKQAKKRGIAPIESYFVDLGRKGKFMVLLDDSGKVFDSDGNPFRFDHILEVKAFGGGGIRHDGREHNWVRNWNALSPGAEIIYFWGMAEFWKNGFYAPQANHITLRNSGTSPFLLFSRCCDPGGRLG